MASKASVASKAAKTLAASTPHAVTEAMASCKAAGRTAFIPFLVAGDPSLSATVSAIKALDSVGADVIELGVPYSDPLADGPTIQAAATRALQQGVVLDQVIDVVRQVAPSISAPIVMFTYFNPIMARGLDTVLRANLVGGCLGAAGSGYSVGGDGRDSQGGDVVRVGSGAVGDADDAGGSDGEDRGCDAGFCVSGVGDWGDGDAWDEMRRVLRG